MCNQQWHLTSCFMMDKQQLLALKTTNKNDRRVVVVSQVQKWTLPNIEAYLVCINQSLVVKSSVVN